MTRLRKLAVKISDTVVRRSLPGYRDWAEATRRSWSSLRAIGRRCAGRWVAGGWRRAASVLRRLRRGQKFQALRGGL